MKDNPLNRKPLTPQGIPIIKEERLSITDLKFEWGEPKNKAEWESISTDED